MTDKNLYIAKENSVDIEWVIVETCSKYYEDEADVYVYENEKTSPNKSINKGFAAANGEYVVFLANDVTVCPMWVDYLLDCFKYSDCGIASLGNNEHRDVVKDEIKEDLYFTVCMMKKEDAWFDPFFTKIYDDTDLIFRLYTQGKKFYKNLNGFVNHKTHSTYGEYCGDKEEYDRSQNYFRSKWSEYSNDSFYKKLAGIK